MSTETAVATFLPSRDGLPWPNRWPDVPALTIPTPLGAIGLGRASGGLCGGMVFAALDLFRAGLRLPAGPQPEPGTPAFGYLVRRLLDSFDLPRGVAAYYEWMALPDTDVWPGLRGAASRTVRDSLPRVRAVLDGGSPCPLGLVLVRSADPSRLALNHQVLACGYDEAGGAVRLTVYDPNHPGRDDLTIEVSRGPGRPRLRYEGASRPLRGFFPVRYAWRDPAPLVG